MSGSPKPKTPKSPVSINSSVNSITKCDFYGCSSFKEILIPPTVTHILNWSFYTCSSLTHISIPPSVSSIGSYAFYNSKSQNNKSTVFGVEFILSHKISNFNQYKLFQGIK